MKRILLIATGGTIASQKTEGALAPQLTSQELLACVPQVAQLCQVDTVQPFNLDSTNINHVQWTQIAQCVQTHYDDYDGFVVTHGTDTMSYTAAALSYLIQNSRKPVVLTGSQKSIYAQDTDARNNLINAFRYACDDRACGVHLVFDGKIILGTRARKVRTKSYNAFTSIDFPEVGIIRDKDIVFYLEERIEHPRPDFYDTLNPRVFVLKLIPGMDPGVFAWLKDRCDVVVIESFGVGGIPCYGDEDFLDAIEDWILAGKTVVMATQVLHEGSDMAIYQVGYRVKEKYEIIEAYDMTLEAVVTKLMWILGRTQSPQEIRRLFYTPVQKDIL